MYATKTKTTKPITSNGFVLTPHAPR